MFRKTCSTSKSRRFLAGLALITAAALPVTMGATPADAATTKCGIKGVKYQGTLHGYKATVALYTKPNTKEHYTWLCAVAHKDKANKKVIGVGVTAGPLQDYHKSKGRTVSAKMIYHPGDSGAIFLTYYTGHAGWWEVDGF